MIASSHMRPAQLVQQRDGPRLPWGRVLVVLDHELRLLGVKLPQARDDGGQAVAERQVEQACKCRSRTQSASGTRCRP